MVHYTTNEPGNHLITTFDDRTPIYRQIAEQIRADVLAGLLGDDEQVMSTTQYAEFHRINPATAAKAFQQLVDEGVIYKRRGVGMFVTPGAAERLRADHRADFVERVVDPLVDEARRLGLSIDDVVDAIRKSAGAAPAGSGQRADRPTHRSAERTTRPATDRKETSQP